jgi:hypothetical protein
LLSTEKLMPLDATNFRKPIVTAVPDRRQSEPVHIIPVPPVPPERGGGDPRRLHIVVEVRLPPPRRRPTTALWWWAVALTMVALAAHAQPATWESYDLGSRPSLAVSLISTNGWLALSGVARNCGRRRTAPSTAEQEVPAATCTESISKMHSDN